MAIQALLVILAVLLFLGVPISYAIAVSSLTAILSSIDLNVAVLTAATNAASSCSGLLIPPSNALITYSLASGGTSVAALFMAGYIPGIIWSLCCCVVGVLLAIKLGYKGTPGKFDWKNLGICTLRALPSLSLIIVVIGGIIGGVFSATEGSAIAVVYALILAFCYRSINLKSLWKIIVDSAKMSGMVVFLVGVSNILGWVMAFLQIPDTRQPVHSLNDLQGKTIRVQDSQIVIDMIRLLGAVPETTAYSDVYSALETGQIDAAENNWPAYYSMEHYKVAPYYLADEHSRVPEVQLASGRTWEALPEEYRQTLQVCARASAQYQRQLWAQEETAACKAALAGGCIQLPLPEEEMQNFRQLIQPLYRKYCADYLPLVEEIQAE